MKGVPHQNLSKETRLDLVLYLINAGRVGLLEEEKSLDLLLHQLRQFPNGKLDDPRARFEIAEEYGIGH